MDKLSDDMKRVEREMDRQQKGQKVMRRDVNDLKRRLGRLRENRERREEWVRAHGMPDKSDDSGEGKKDE